MPENRKLYWCEDTIIGKKPQISDKAKRYVHQFLGWYDEDGKEYQEGDRICVDGNLVLTAKWEMSCNIAYHGNGQTIGDDYTQEKDKSLIISDTEKYKFDGKFYKGLVGDDTFQRTETYKKDENGNLLDKNNKTVTDERRAAKLTSLNPDTGKEEPCEEQYSVKAWATQPDCQYAVLVHMLAQVCDMNVGELVHVIADAHIYDRHIPLVEELIQRPIHDAPKFALNPEIKDCLLVKESSHHCIYDRICFARSGRPLDVCQWILHRIVNRKELIQIDFFI